MSGNCLVFCLFPTRIFSVLIFSDISPPPAWLDRMSASIPRHVIWESEGLVAYLHRRPWTPGTVVLESSKPGRLGGSIFHLPEQEYLSWLTGARAVAELLCNKLGVRRCALVSRPHIDTPAQVRISMTRLLHCTVIPVEVFEAIQI